MLRIIGSILLGYVTMALLIMVSFSLLWMVMGTEIAFRAGTTRVTWAWLAVSLPLSVIAAAVGGMVTVWVARSREFGGLLGLAGLILVLGVGSALGQMTAGTTPADLPPSHPLSAFEAAMSARQPLWVAWSLPLLGIIGAFLGGGLVLSRRAVRGRHIQEAQVDSRAEDAAG